MLGAVMGRIDPMSAGRAGRTRWMRVAAVVALLLVAAGCGDDPGKPFAMPAGTEYDTEPADRVLVVVESQNECGTHGTCVPNPASPCDIGAGNRQGLVVYRLGPTGRLVSATGTQAGVIPEEILATDDNPRRIVSHPNDPTLLYVATVARIQVFRLSPGGGSACIDETPTDQEVFDEIDDDLDPIDMLIDPTVGTNGVLYFAAKEGHRVDAYDIAPDGTLPSLPSSCIVGSTAAEFTSIATVNAGMFAVGSRERIEIYARVDGQFPDIQNPPTPTPTATPIPGEPTSTVTATPAPTGLPVTATPSPAPTCVDATRITGSLSSLSGGRVTAMEFLPLPKPDADSIGDLIVAEEVTKRLISFPIDPNGIIDGRDNGSTARGGFYQRLLRIDRNGTTFLYTTAFQEGKTDAYQLGDATDDDGDDRLSGDPLSKTRSDPFSLPVGLALDGTNGPILYVAQQGLGRADGFRVREDGSTDEVPTTSTPMRELDGRRLELFPTDVVIVPLP